MRSYLTTTLLAITLFVSGCAKMGPPPGGPVDKRPPEILSTVPAPDSTNVDVTTSIRITFGEPVRRESLSGAFSLSPPPPGSVRAKWKGETLTLDFDPPLRKDRTYVLTLGTELSDQRGNRLEDAFHLAFSTGEKLDQARVAGRLKAEGGAQGWNIIGYLQPELPDTVAWEPNPAIDLPDATTQAGADGSWVLQNLRSGTWRVFAYKDQDKDRLHTPWLEPLAVPPFDVEASEDSIFVTREVVLVSAPARVTPQPMRISARQRDLLEVKFDPAPRVIRGLFSLDPPPKGLELEEGLNWVMEDKNIRFAWKEFKPGDSTIVRLKLSSQPAGDAVWLRIQGTFGGPESLDTTFTVDLRKSSSVDSFPPNVVRVHPVSGSKLHKGLPAINVLFSERIDQTVQGGVRLITPEQDTLEATHTWRQPETLVIPLPHTPDGGSYQLHLLGEGIRDLAGNALTDSLLSYSFIYLPEDSLGKVAGSVVTHLDRARVHLTFRSLSGTQLPVDLTVPEGGAFTLPAIPAGNWLVEGWVDRDQTDIFDPGSAVPFRPADPYMIHPDTVLVRARWESGGVQAIFP